jgi:two-component system, LytTR family, response regulator AlgR
MTSDSPISVFIVDDESLARERLKRLIKTNTLYQVCGEAENGAHALSSIPDIKPDIVLLDIRMPGVDGLDVAQQLSKMHPPPAIIFCTAYDEYAFKAFDYNAIGYLLKPVRQEDLFKALGQAKQLSQLQIKQLTQQNDDKPATFTAHSWQGHELISFEDIFYFKADQKYLTVVHRHGETISDQTLKELEQRFSNQLVRVHRNTLINLSHVSSLTKDHEGHYQILFKDCTDSIQVSRRHVSELKKQLTHL